MQNRFGWSVKRSIRISFCAEICFDEERDESRTTNTSRLRGTVEALAHAGFRRGTRRKPDYHSGC